VRIRQATVDDVGALVDLTGQLGYPTTEAELRERLARLLTSVDDAVLLAVHDGRPIAWAHVGVDHVLQASRRTVLHGLVVDEAHRSGGIGHDLLAAAEAWAVERGCETMIVPSGVTRERAHRFYEREGYRLQKTRHVFAKPLV
jgi:GNAT superfamily N-acetyltransferase